MLFIYLIKDNVHEKFHARSSSGVHPYILFLAWGAPLVKTIHRWSIILIIIINLLLLLINYHWLFCNSHISQEKFVTNEFKPAIQMSYFARLVTSALTTFQGLYGQVDFNLILTSTLICVLVTWNCRMKSTVKQDQVNPLSEEFVNVLTEVGKLCI